MNGFDKINLEGIASFLALYTPCHICEYNGKNKCESITHNGSSCVKGIIEWLRKEI